MSIDFDPESVYLHQTPMFHAASMGGIMGTPSAGGTPVFMPLFDPSGAMDIIETHHETHTMMVPTLHGMSAVHPPPRPTAPRPARSHLARS